MRKITPRFLKNTPGYRKMYLRCRKMRLIQILAVPDAFRRVPKMFLIAP